MGNSALIKKLGASCTPIPGTDIVPYGAQNGVVLCEKVVEVPQSDQILRRRKQNISNNNNNNDNISSDSNSENHNHSNLLSKEGDCLLHDKKKTKKDIGLSRKRKQLMTQMDIPVPYVNEWMELEDKETGNIYYHNKTTGVSVWSKPEGFDRAQEIDSLHEQARGSYWIKIEDSRGRTFYYDLVSKTTRWDRPLHFIDTKRAVDKKLIVSEA